jgi:hypothetical protein
MQELKRKLGLVVMLSPVLSILSGCRANAMSRPPVSASDRLKGMGVILVVDAVAGARMLGNEFFADGSEVPFYASSVTRQGNRSTISLPGGRVPETVRVVWKNSSELIRRPDNPKKTTYAGSILGDHTIRIASRIPDEVLAEIRKNGGGLRLKFRLHPEGVYFGWDIERFEGGLPRHSMAGGDFREAGLAYGLPGTLVYEAYLDAYTDRARVNPAAKPFLETGEYFIPPRSDAIWRRGWFIDSSGRRVLTDH